MPKAGDKKSNTPNKKQDPRSEAKSKAKAVAKPAAKPAPTKAAKNAPVKAAAPPARPAPNPAPTPKPVPTTTGATGRDHPAVTEHSPQAEVTRKLYEQLQARKNPSGAPGAGGRKGAFDPNQFRGGKGNMGSAHSQMIRRTQGRGGGGGGGGGGSAA